MICNTIGQTADSYQSIYVTGGTEVAEVYGGINYADPIFYKTETITGDAPLMYDSYPGGLTDYTIFGNSYQNGVPDPDHPVDVVSVGDLVTSGEHAEEYVIPVTVSDGTNTQTYPIYLSAPLRRIGDYADEIDFKAGTVTRNNDIIDILSDTSQLRFKYLCREGTQYEYACFNYLNVIGGQNGLSNIFKTFNYYYNGLAGPGCVTFHYATSVYFSAPSSIDTVEKCIQWLTDIYTATGKRPVFVRPIATPTTEQITVPAIPTINGQNTLSIGTTLRPSSVSITGHIKPSSIYGNLTDVNGTYINDKDGVQIKVTG